MTNYKSQPRSDKVAGLIPAFEAASSIEAVVNGTRRMLATVLVVDDGSADNTANVARTAGATVVTHTYNQGKGAALRTGFFWAHTHGFSHVVTLDADGQHETQEIEKFLQASVDRSALVLGVRDLAGAGAPLANRLSNAFSNWSLTHVTHTALLDTQCGMRRYPVDTVLALGVQEDRFGFEAEVIMRAIRAGVPLMHVPISVNYPPSRTTHFRNWVDTGRIASRIIRTLVNT